MFSDFKFYIIIYLIVSVIFISLILCLTVDFVQELVGKNGRNEISNGNSNRSRTSVNEIEEQLNCSFVFDFVNDDFLQFVVVNAQVKFLEIHLVDINRLAEMGV